MQETLATRFMQKLTVFPWYQKEQFILYAEGGRRKIVRQCTSILLYFYGIFWIKIVVIDPLCNFVSRNRVFWAQKAPFNYLLNKIAANPSLC